MQFWLQHYTLTDTVIRKAHKNFIEIVGTQMTLIKLIYTDFSPVIICRTSIISVLFLKLIIFVEFPFTQQS
jgi:hypothetical protein